MVPPKLLQWIPKAQINRKRNRTDYPGTSLCGPSCPAALREILTKPQTTSAPLATEMVPENKKQRKISQFIRKN